MEAIDQFCQCPQVRNVRWTRLADLKNVIPSILRPTATTLLRRIMPAFKQSVQAAPIGTHLPERRGRGILQCVADAKANSPSVRGKTRVEHSSPHISQLACIS